MAKRLAFLLIALVVVVAGVVLAVRRSTSVNHRALLDQAFSNARGYNSFEEHEALGSTLEAAVKFLPSEIDALFSVPVGTMSPTQKAGTVEIGATLGVNSLYFKVSSDDMRKYLEEMTNTIITHMAIGKWQYVGTGDQRFAKLASGLNNHTSASEYFQLGPWTDKLSLKWITFGKSATYLDTVKFGGVSYARYKMEVNKNPNGGVPGAAFEPITMWVTTGAKPLPFGWSVGASTQPRGTFTNWGTVVAPNFAGATALPN
jgi:hypothetical protein